MPIYRPPSPVGSPPLGGNYFYPLSPSAAGTSATLGNGTLKVAPWAVPWGVSIARIAADVATIGDVGSKFRPAIYADAGTYYPGALLLDPGQIAGDSATVQELTVSLGVGVGIVWIGGVVQSAATTQPTMRICSNWTPPQPVPLGTSLPAAAGLAIGLQTGSVTGALPSSFPGAATPTANVPRLILRTA